MTFTLGALFAYFQLIMLILFAVTFFGRTLYLKLAKGINPITIGNKSGGLRQLVELAFPVWLILWMIEVMRVSLPLEMRVLPRLFDLQLLDWMPAKVAGLLMILFGYGLFVAALASFGDSWRVGVDESKPGDLVTRGIFSVSRNPIFVYLNLYSLGSFLINGTLIFLIFTVLLMAALHYQILQEEKFLSKTYGPAYDSYRARTARYLPLFSLIQNRHNINTDPEATH